MATTRRPAAMRALAGQLDKRFGTRFEAQYDSGAIWRLQWNLGPAWKTVRAAVDQAADQLGGAEVKLYRDRGGDREIALAVIRLARAGQLEHPRAYEGKYATHLQAEDYLNRTEYPEKAADEREEAMAARLMQAATRRRQFGNDDYVDEYAMCNLVDERGIAWLLEETAADQLGQNKADGGLPETACGEPAGPTAGQNKADRAALGRERLTARYTQGEAARAWQRTGQALPARTAVESALADPDLSARDALEVLAVLQELRAELEGQERRAAALLASGVASHELTYAQVGAVLGGLTRQSAHAWVAGRLEGVKPRRRAPCGH